MNDPKYFERYWVLWPSDDENHKGPEKWFGLVDEKKGGVIAWFDKLDDARIARFFFAFYQYVEELRNY